MPDVGLHTVAGVGSNQRRPSRLFTDRYPHPIGMAADVAKLPDGSCECQALSAICPCRSWCSGGNGRTATDGVRTRHLICRFARRNGRCDALGRRSTAGAVDVGLASQACCPGHPRRSDCARSRSLTIPLSLASASVAGGTLWLRPTRLAVRSPSNYWSVLPRCSCRTTTRQGSTRVRSKSLEQARKSGAPGGVRGWSPASRTRPGCGSAGPSARRGIPPRAPT